MASKLSKRWRGVARTGILAVVGLALVAQPALGEVICKKRRGPMFIRAACRRKEREDEAYRVLDLLLTAHQQDGLPPAP